MRLTSRTSIIVGAISLAAIAAPAASAGVGLDVRPNPDQQSTHAGLVRPNPDQETTHTGLVAPPVLRVARASELAAINRGEVQQEAARSYNPPAGARYSSAENDAYAAFARPVALSAPSVKAPAAGFDYGAAAVGAGLAAAIIVLIAAGGLVMRRRRPPQFG